MTDQEIIEHLQHDRYSAAVNGVYSVLPEAKRFVRANSGTSQDAEDIFQDALVVLCRKVKSGNFVLTAPLKTYLLAIVRNCWLQELRQRKKMPQAEDHPDAAESETADELPYDTAKAAFNALGEKCRRLLMLFYFNGKNFKTIAAELGFSDEPTAKNQKYRCLQKAKEQYSSLLKIGAHE